jgi:hypothetical protein
MTQAKRPDVTTVERVAIIRHLIAALPSRIPIDRVDHTMDREMFDKQKEAFTLILQRVQHHIDRMEPWVHT